MDPTLTMETFGQINGPAIIFPFVREQLANLTMKANIPPILLPPINFVKRAKEEGSNATRRLFDRTLPLSSSSP